MSGPIRFALVGAGGIGAYHLAAIQRLARENAAQLRAVADPTSGRLKELHDSLVSRGVRWYADYRDLLAGEPGLDAVVIATPIPFHYEMALACLDRGVFVHLEKPPVPLVQQLETLIRADRARRVSVGFQMIHSRCVRRMKELLAGGAVGEIASLRAGGCWPRLDSYYQRAAWAGKMRLGGQPVFDGPATNALAHLIHHVMFLAAPGLDDFAVPVEVRGELYRARRIESYDTACLRGTFPTGAEFCVAVTHATQSLLPFQLEVHGSGGWLRLSGDGARLETSAGERLDHAESTQQLLDVSYDCLVAAIQGRRPCAGSALEDARGYVRATNALLVSSGGIHDIGAQWIDRYEHGGEGDGGCDVHGLTDAVSQAFSQGRLFSELGVAWATARPAPVRLDSFDSLDLNRYA